MARLNQRNTIALTFILGTLSAFGPLTTDMYLPGMPALVEDFSTDSGSVQLTLSLFFLGLAFGQAFYGPIADRIGRRIPLLFGCGLYTLASIGCALAPTIEVLIFMRCLQALGGCAGMVLSRTVVRDLFETKDAARMYSFLILVMGLAPITAPFLGGQILLYFDWRAIFWFLTFFGLLCFLLVAFGLPESLPTERRQHLTLGSVLGKYGKLLRDKPFMGFAIVNGCISGGMFAYISGSPFVFIDLHGVAPENFGWIFGANAAGLIATSQFNRRLIRSYDSRTILRGMLLTYMVSSVVLVMAAVSQIGGMWGLLLPLFICVSCNGMSGPNATAVALEPYGQIAGIASAVFGATQFLIGAASGALVGQLDNGTSVPMTAVMCLCGVIALAAFFLLANSKGAVQPASQTAA